MLGVVCDDLGRDHCGGMVNKFPACRHAPAPSLRDIPSRRRTRMPAVPAGHEKTAARSARKSRKYDHTTITLSFNFSTLRSVFVLGRRPISCPAKRGFVSAGSGGDAAHRMGMGWRRPCSHGSARSLVSRAANGGPPRRRLSWSRASASRNDGFRHKHPNLCTKPQEIPHSAFPRHGAMAPIGQGGAMAQMKGPPAGSSGCRRLGKGGIGAARKKRLRYWRFLL